MNDMKSTVIEVASKYLPGGQVDLVLLQRGIDCTIPHARGSRKGDKLPGDLDPTSKFSRLSVSSDITPILTREAVELEKAAKVAASTQDESLPFIAHAQQVLQERASHAVSEPATDAISSDTLASVLASSQPQEDQYYYYQGLYRRTFAQSTNQINQ